MSRIHPFCLLAIGLFLVSAPTKAQILQEGSPASFQAGIAMQLSAEIPLIELPTVDVAALQAEDVVNDQIKDMPWRFGFNHTVSISPETAGQWFTLSNGDRLWQLRLRSSGAKSINLQFDDFQLPLGAELFIYTPDHQTVIGAITAQNNKPHRQLGTTIFPGDQVILEYREPAAVAGEGKLHLSTVTHGYRGILSHDRGLGDSGSCNNNVVCPLGDAWDAQIRSVAMIVVGGNGICTGALVNNSCEDETPYFLTANHCLSANVSNWVFLFNWESPDCGLNLNGPLDQSVSGATLLASNADTDVALLELSASPPDEYEVYYAGWDNTGAVPSNTICVHHPAGDIKKISFDNDAPVSTNWGNPSAAVWEVINWEDGTTEPGSSGSPLFDQNGRIIGQLFGGGANCSNNLEDNYGRFDVSWNNGNDADERLADWLGTCNANITLMDGLDTKVDLDATLAAIVPLTGIRCEATLSPQVVLENNGVRTLTSAEIQYDINGMSMTPISWTGNLQSGFSDTIALPAFTLNPGATNLQARVTSPNNSSDQQLDNDSINADFSFSEANREVNLVINTDFFASEIRWEVRSSNNAITYYQGGNYPNGQETYVESLCLDTGCYNFIIVDAGSDGMVAGRVGSYNIEDVDQTLLLDESGDDFTNLKLTEFCLDSIAEDTLSDGLRKLILDDRIQLFPNPADRGVRLKITNPVNLPISIQIFDQLGTQKRNFFLDSFPSEGMMLKTDDLPSGVYLLRISTNNQLMVKRFIIQR